MATMGLGQVWMQDTKSKYIALMTKLMIALVWSRDSSPRDMQRLIINLLGNMHVELTSELDKLMVHIFNQQGKDLENEDLIVIH